MATDADFIRYVCDQVKSAGVVTSKKMFGEYMVYVNAKPLLLVCDNTVYVKMLDCIKTVMAEAETGTPYPGAKPHYILDIDDSALSCEVVRILEPVTPLPKPRKRKN
jgi:TfoX/Sxy family transcriptional regulator of competence genes